MAERLTECIDSHLLDNGEMVKEYSLNSKIKLNHFSCMDIPNAVYDKLGMLEDIMEKYNCKDVEDLQKELSMNKLLHETIAELSKMVTKAENERDTWQKACELACEHISTVHIITNDDMLENQDNLSTYFYQQAKTEGNDERN